MNMTESARLILGLREVGLTDREVADFVLWVESGEDQYRPHNIRNTGTEDAEEKE